ncbi:MULTISPECIES: ABC transporter ATP-binding protein [Xanthomonas]|uniref:Spermidine/putrescine import ATP-binding protein PotA n=1 Tax=Xanthomonas arboricola TaxID=56448 RepID=A0AB73GTL6_9XANT|nr:MULTISPECIES: polyamine ABC transporter ATP-binding protein [Xanthomonas]MBB3796699.1 putrescine transport system ATP-binding protein [Xanthomonas arboricola]MBB4604031.1 putrescine transport system ATP-binding protein [Xanthomonas arboricola]MBB4769434.1 putrescine transport system ATP-binding protein [Xanthomonas arboricola]MBB5669237.1 putrescine transport system ATP-binding protein [Xanthomonas arboricola]MXV46189.1 polyamine ABC transporter ATP-binding protein [Xanthomonas sp. LMG 8993
MAVTEAAAPPLSPGDNAYLSIREVRKEFDGVVAVDEVSLQIRKGEIFALLGGSGSGKSTLLRCLAGFERPTKGRIVLDGQPIDGLPPYERPINMMFQSYALFPHMSVEQNIAFGLKQEALSKPAIAARVGEMLELVQLGNLARRKPHQLSGGQQQRVALARSLAKRPKLLLLDEPMGALDKKLRAQMQLELVNIIETSGVTCVMVTHDQEEAMSMATRIALMDQGWIQQVGTPDEIYEQPANRFAADFIGSVNLIDAVIVEDKPDYVGLKASAFDANIRIGHGITGFEGQAVAFALRPEKLVIGKDEPAQACNKAQGVIEDIAYFGSHSVYHVRLPGGFKLMANFANRQRWASEALTWGDAVWLSWGEDDGVVLTA